MELALKMGEGGIVDGRDTIVVESEGVFQSCLGTNLESQFDGEQNLSFARDGLGSASSEQDQVGKSKNSSKKWKAAVTLSVSLRTLPRWNIEHKDLLATPIETCEDDHASVVCGYVAETERALGLCQSFVNEKKAAALVISGEEGMGKTTFSNIVKRILEKRGIPIW
jgi:predicted AAA+ superfamily ATPase